MWGELAAVILVILLVWVYIHYMHTQPADQPDDSSSDTAQKSKTDTFVSRPQANAEALDPESDTGESWVDLIKSSELDPSVEDNHARFVRDATRFSSGANFTSVADDNTNLAFTNFIGLRRPSHVSIMADARQIPDIDQNVLQRNKPFRFN